MQPGMHALVAESHWSHDRKTNIATSEDVTQPSLNDTVVKELVIAGDFLDFWMLPMDLYDPGFPSRFL